MFWWIKLAVLRPPAETDSPSARSPPMAAPPSALSAEAKVTSWHCEARPRVKRCGCQNQHIYIYMVMRFGEIMTFFMVMIWGTIWIMVMIWEHTVFFSSPMTILCTLGKYISKCTSSTTQGGGGSFKNRKPIGEIGCCESGMAERSHWWIERRLISLTLSLTIYLPTYLSSYVSIYLSIYPSLSLSLSFI